MLQPAARKVSEFNSATSEYPNAREVGEVLERLIAWTNSRLSTVGYDSKICDQATVKARLLPENCNFLIWSAFPRKNDGAKLSILEGKVGKSWEQPFEPDVRTRFIRFCDSPDVHELRMPMVRLADPSVWEEFERELTWLHDGLISGRISPSDPE